MKRTQLKPLFLPLLVLGGALALVFRATARRSKTAPASASGGPYEALDAYLDGQMRRLRVPGGILAVVEGERIVHQRAFGRARPGGGPPTLETPFFIGSLTKSFTALAVMQLVEQGRVELDAPVQRYLPWFRVADPQASAQMSVRHLLNQTSGLPALEGELVLADFDQRPGAPERQARALAGLKLSRPVGAGFEYSNLNFNLLGLVVEAASGESYAAYLQEQVLDPLGMRRTFTSRAAAEEHGLARGHRYWFGRPQPAPELPVPIASLASGQLISCAADMARYLGAYLDGGRSGAVQVLSPAGVAELQRGVLEYVVAGRSYGFYGMGWFEVDLGGVKTYSHSGNVPEYAAFMALIPGRNQGLALLLNADPYGLPPVLEEVGLGLTAVLAGQPPPPIRLGFVPWLMRLLPLLPLLQVAGLIAALRPAHPRKRAWRLLPGLLSDLSLAAVVLYLHSSGLLRFLDLFMPDLAWTARLGGGLAGLGAVLRSGLLLRGGR